MAIYTYDGEADVLYVLLMDEEKAAIERTEQIDPDLHVDLDADGQVVGVEFLYPRSNGVRVDEVRERHGVDLEIPFSIGRITTRRLFRGQSEGAELPLGPFPDRSRRST